jgi:NAD(P)H dehydrogenase (quinone)
MILLTGASGKTGRTVLRVLSESGNHVRALVFHPDQTNQVEALGAKEVIVGDMRNPDFIRTALRGVNSIYHICPNVHPEEIMIGQVMIDAAASVGINHFVYHSVLHPKIEVMPHHWNKMRVEERLFESRLPFTILQPAVYMQNILSQWKGITETGKYAIPYSVESRVSMVDLEDIALVVSHILGDTFEERNSLHCGATYELVGTQAMSPNEIAAILSQELDHPIIAESISIEAWERQTRASGLDDYRIKTLIKMFEYYDKFGLVGNTNVLRLLLNRSGTDFSAFVKKETEQRMNSMPSNRR